MKLHNRSRVAGFAVDSLDNSHTRKHETKTEVQKMRQIMEGDLSLTKQDGWDELWQKGVTPWDFNKPTPALAAELDAAEWGRQESYRILVPGCGSGFDLLTMASHQQGLQQRGFVSDSVIVGLDISLTSLEKAKQVLVNEYRPNPHDGSPCILLIHGDFFDRSTWTSVYSTIPDIQDKLTSCVQKDEFDLVYDYVFFCALPPDLRLGWGQAVASLLRPGTGRLLTLVFPIHRAPRMKGPPYPVTIDDYKQVLESKRVCMISKPCETPFTIPERVGKELVCWWIRGKNRKSSL